MGDSGRKQPYMRANSGTGTTTQAVQGAQKVILASDNY